MTQVNDYNKRHLGFFFMRMYSFPDLTRLQFSLQGETIMQWRSALWCIKQMKKRRSKEMPKQTAGAEMLRKCHSGPSTRDGPDLSCIVSQRLEISAGHKGNPHVCRYSGNPLNCSTWEASNDPMRSCVTFLCAYKPSFLLCLYPVLSFTQWNWHFGMIYYNTYNLWWLQ